jgi:hypothetical protein
MYLIVITDAKADLDNFTLEKHHQLTRDRMLQKMKNASANEPVSLTIDGHPALRRINRDGKGHECCFSSHDRGRRRSFPTNPRLDTQIPLATTEPTAARNYRNFSLREVDGIRTER